MAASNGEGDVLVSRLRALREAADLSQAALAARVGVSRQALIAIEAGRQVPSTLLSLQLARALGRSVEELFALATEPALEATLAPDPGGWEPASRVALGQLDGRWVAHGVRDSTVTADGIVTGRSRGRVVVEPFGDGDPRHNILVAGCAPLLGILARRAERRFRDTRVCWLPANSRRALDLLRAGLVHVAGVHLFDTHAGHDNLRVIGRRFRDRRMRVVNLTRWQEGLVVAPGNPLGLCGGEDLARPDLRVATREAGSGARQLSDRLLRLSGAEPAEPAPELSASSHAAVAQLVGRGAADVGVAIEGAALSAGLDFVPLSDERFDLVMPAELAEQPPVSRLLDMLTDAPFRREAAQLPGYDASDSGQSTVLEAVDAR